MLKTESPAYGFEYNWGHSTIIIMQDNRKVTDLQVELR
jgi:hypothetical protein